MFPNSSGYRHHPRTMFSSQVSTQKDYDKKNLMRDRGIIYQTNGTGRDTYIFNDDGGFNKMKGPRS